MFFRELMVLVTPSTPLYEILYKWQGSLARAEE